MDVIANLGLGFAVALTLQNVAYCFLVVLLGTVIGVLPGIGATQMRVPDFFGSRVVNPSADLDVDMLTDIATQTGGKFFRATDSNQIAEAYRTIDAYFPDYDTASAAVAGPEAGALFPNIFGLATGGVRILFSDIEES